MAEVYISALIISLILFGALRISKTRNPWKRGVIMFNYAQIDPVCGSKYNSILYTDRLTL